MSKHQKPEPRPIQDHDRLVQEIDQQYLTKGLGVLDRRTGERHPTLGRVGEALHEAASREKTEQEIDDHLEEQLHTEY